jgi:hypothetical protein
MLLPSGQTLAYHKRLPLYAHRLLQCTRIWLGYIIAELSSYMTNGNQTLRVCELYTFGQPFGDIKFLLKQVASFIESTR